MDQPANREFADALAGALDWWRDAGVDCDFLDEPQNWLAAREHSEQPPAQAKPNPDASSGRAARAPAPPPARFDPAALPADLNAFTRWWLEAPLPGDERASGRIAPQGPADAPLMVLVEQPEGEDRDALLSGQQGRLLDAMLAAFGIRRDAVYLASALPRHTPAAEWGGLAELGLGQILTRHVALATPKRLLVLGGNILPLIGHELPQRAAALRQFNQEGRSIPMLASWGLPALRAQPRARQALWKAWLEWTAG